MVELEPKSTEEIRPGSVIQQSSFWAEVKSRQGLKTRAFEIETNEFPDNIQENNKKSGLLKDDMLIILRSIGPGVFMAYIPYGPELLPDPHNRGLWLEEIGENLRLFLSENCLFIRFDLSWESPWANEEDCFVNNGTWIDPPEPGIQEIRMNFNTINRQLRKAPTDVLPSNTVLLDLKKENHELINDMRPKTRYNVRLSGRKGIKVRTGNIDDIQLWYDLYCKTAARNSINCHDFHYFKSIFQSRQNHTYQDTTVHLLIAGLNGEPLAGMFLSISGNRATYLYGASSSEKRNTMPTYALQWEAIQIAKKAGCREYDLFGISQRPDPSHPMYGLYRFKTGFGGRMFHRQGCWDYVLDETRYECFRAAELTMQGYHI